MKKMVIVRVADGQNFRNSVPHNIWGSKKNDFKILQNALLCFATSKKATNGEGRIIAFADFHSINKRLHSNEKLGWVKQPDQKDDWKCEINYTNLYETDDNDKKYKRTFRMNRTIFQVKEQEAEQVYQLYIDTVEKIETEKHNKEVHEATEECQKKIRESNNKYACKIRDIHRKLN